MRNDALNLKFEITHDAKGDQGIEKERYKPKAYPPLAAVFWSFAKIGAFMLGGGYAMVPLIRGELVFGRAWLSEDEFAEILGLAQTAPGAIAVNTAVLAGFRLRRLAGALTGCLGVILAPFFIILAIAATFARLDRLPLFKAVFSYVRPAVVGLIVAAALGMARSLLRSWLHLTVAGGLFLAAVALNPHPAVLIALAALCGYLLRRVLPATGGGGEDEP